MLPTIGWVTIVSVQLLLGSGPSIYFSNYNENSGYTSEQTSRYSLSKGVTKNIGYSVWCYNDTIEMSLNRDVYFYPDSVYSFNVPCATNQTLDHTFYTESYSYQYKITLQVTSTRYQRKILRINDLMMIGEALSMTTGDQVRIHIKSDVPEYSDMQCPRSTWYNTNRNSLIALKGMAVPCDNYIKV